MIPGSSNRLEGLEPDNLLAFLALLGLLRALDTADIGRSHATRLHARVAWDVEPPLRPRIYVAPAASADDIAAWAAQGVERLAAAHDFGDAKNLAFSRDECRRMLIGEARAANCTSRARADLLAALMSDAVVKKNDKSMTVQPTPMCLQFGQGHQYFLERLASVPRSLDAVVRGRGRSRQALTAAQNIAEALFQPWQRIDPTFSFRWDPEEDVRYALMAGDPTDPAYKPRTQHGANCLAAVGLAALTVVPATNGRTLAVIGGEHGKGFSFAWPIWHKPATLAAIRALLCHPQLRSPGGLQHLGVHHVYVAKRISVGKFMNFTRAQPLPAQ